MKNNLEIVPVSRMEEVLKHALLRMPEPITWEEGVVKAVEPPVDDEPVGVVAH